MTTYYQVEVQVVTVDGDGWRMARSVPTFFLNADVQGIRDKAHAESIAKKIVNPLDNPNIAVLATAYACAST